MDLWPIDGVLGNLTILVPFGGSMYENATLGQMTLIDDPVRRQGCNDGIAQTDLRSSVAGDSGREVLVLFRKRSGATALEWQGLRPAIPRVARDMVFSEPLGHNLRPYRRLDR